MEYRIAILNELDLEESSWEVNESTIKSGIYSVIKKLEKGETLQVTKIND